jgi:hypothetical protein
MVRDFMSYLEIRQRDTMFRVVGLAEKQVPETELLRFHFELLDDGNHSLPALDLVRRDLGMGQLASRKNLLLRLKCKDI